MKRRHRLGLAGVALASAVASIWILTAFGSATEGPIGALLERAAAAVYALEYSVRLRFTGPGRSRQLEWFEQYRADDARLRRPAEILLGAYDNHLPGSADGLVRLERALGTTFPLVQVYTAWGDKPDHAFPLRTVTMIWTLGSVPVVTWEPWLATFDNARHPFLPVREQRDRRGLAAIARGEYDFYVDAWARAAAEFDRPMFLRFAHEMNDPYRYPWGPQHNTKEEFIDAWRHVVERFKRAGARKVVWVWSPHVAYQYWDLYYPGDDYVDWTATGVLNYGPIARWSSWWSFEEIFGTKYSRLASFGKPVMVAELGSLSVGGDRQQWYLDALEGLPTRYPAVKAVIFFNVVADQTVTLQKVNWSLPDDADVAAAVRAAIGTWAPPRNNQ